MEGKGNGLDLILNGDNVKKAIKCYEKEAPTYPFRLIIKNSRSVIAPRKRANMPKSSREAHADFVFIFRHIFIIFTYDF